MNYDTLNSSSLNVSSISLSIADPFSGLITGFHKPRSILLRSLPVSGDTVTPVDLSTDGYVSAPTDSPYQQFKEHLINPYNFAVSLPIPDLCGSTQLGVGNITLRNNDGTLDSISRLDWLGIEQELYLGPPDQPLTQFTKISKTVSAGLSWNLDTINVLSRDIRFKLQTPLQQNRYRGTGACLRMDGSNDYGTATLASPPGNMTIMFALRPNSSIGSQRNLVGWRNGGGAGNRLVDIGRAGTDRIGWAARNDAGTQFLCDAGVGAAFTSAQQTELNYIFAVLDVSNAQMKLYINTTSTPVTTTAITGVWNTSLSNLTIGRLPDGASNFGLGDIDEVRIYSYALSSSEMADFKQREALGTESGLYSYWKFNEGSGTTAANSVSGQPSLTLNGSPAWVGSLEGDSSLVGTVKPTALGVCRQVEPKWVDTQRLVAQWHDGSMQEITTVRDSGDPITFGVDLTDIYSAVPAAGTYNTCKAKGLSRFGSTPVGTITGDIKGANGGSLGYADTAATIDRKLMVDYGGLDNILEIDDYAYDILAATNAAKTGKYYEQLVNIDVASSEVLSDIRAWGGPTRTGVKTVGRIDDPQNSTSTVSWDIHIIDRSQQGYNRNPMGVRYKEVVVGYRPYYKTLSPDQIAGVVGLATRDDYGKDYRFVSKTIDGASEDAGILTVYTSMDSEADARAEMVRLANFFSRDLEVISLTLTSGLLTHFIGTVLDLTITQVLQSGQEVIRYSTDGRKYVVVSVAESIATGQPDRFSVVLVG